MTYSFSRTPGRARFALALGAAGIAACADTLSQPGAGPGPAPGPTTAVAPLAGRFSEFQPLSSSAACNVVAPPATRAGFAAYRPMILPDGYTQTIITTELDAGVQQAGTGAGNFDMLTLNETGPEAGRFLYRTHETGSNGALSVTDIQTGHTRIAAQASHYQNLDGIVWTPWGTVLFAEENITATLKDPAVPNAVGGLLYEHNPATRTTRPLPAFGARSHEGLRFDAQGNLYGISESTPGSAGQSGALFKFTPDRAGDLTSGQLYALKVADAASRTGAATWVPLDRNAVQINSDLEAIRVGATGWGRPEDVEIETRGGVQLMYVASTSERLVLRVELRGDAASVSNYVKEGMNVTGLDNPDNLELDSQGNLYIAADADAADIWLARSGGATATAATDVVRFASLTDCAAEFTGIYFDAAETTLYVNVQHAGGPLLNDLTMAVLRTTNEAGNAAPTITNYRLDPATGPLSVGTNACGPYTACVRFTLTDPDGAADAPFKTVIAWGDGTVWSPNTVPANTPLVVPHKYTAAGTYPVRVSVTDRRGATSMQTLLLHVQP